MPEHGGLLARILGVYLTPTSHSPICASCSSALGSTNAFVATITSSCVMMEILNLQPKASKAKPYQVRQVRNVIVMYRLGRAPDDQI